jgi:hypothetical protein
VKHGVEDVLDGTNDNTNETTNERIMDGRVTE